MSLNQLSSLFFLHWRPDFLSLSLFIQGKEPYEFWDPQEGARSPNLPIKREKDVCYQQIMASRRPNSTCFNRSTAGISWFPLPLPWTGLQGGNRVLALV